MRELITMWQEVRMIMLVAVIAASYAALLVIFAGLVIVPGISSIRPANALPVVFGLLFGPAAPWGAAIGNLINDLFTGQLSPASGFGFVGNFFYGLLAYKLWGNLGPLSSGHVPDFRTQPIRQFVEFAVIGLGAASVCAAIIGWGVEVLGLFPFSVLGTVVFFNGAIAIVLLGPPLLYLLYPRVEALGLFYPDVLDEDDFSSTAGGSTWLSALGVVVVSGGWFLAGVGISLGVYDISVGASESAVAGMGGSGVQMLLGAVAFGVLLICVARTDERLSRMGHNTKLK